MEIPPGKRHFYERCGCNVIPFIRQVLYTDPQEAPVVCFCERCGGECYHPCLRCPDCEELP